MIGPAEVERVARGLSNLATHDEYESEVELLDEAAALLRTLAAENEALWGEVERLTTVADEAFGPFPVQSADENLTAIEQGVFRLKRELAERDRTIGGLENAMKTARDHLDIALGDSDLLDAEDGSPVALAFGALLAALSPGEAESEESGE